MTTFALSNRALADSGRRREAIRPPLRVGRFFLLFSLLVLASFMSLLYLMEYNGIHTKGYTLKKLELERDELSVAREMKHTNLARVTSLRHVKESEAVRRMIPVRNPIYFQGDSAFAARN